MKNKTLNLLLLICAISIGSCSQSQNPENSKTTEVSNTSSTEVSISKKEPVKKEPHKYGGWYCPDNLNGFPPVDISEWENVPVINGRMATKEETQTPASLIFVDPEKYPDAKVLDITLPKLATFQSDYTNREEYVIIIQALNIDNDSIVGFRYLNGGNGSARLDEVRFVTHNEIAMMPNTKFVSYSIQINTTQDKIWEILTKEEYAQALRPIFDKNNELKDNWRKTSNVNYNYPVKGVATSNYANMLYGCFYIQNDYDNLFFNEKFLLLEDSETETTELKIVCGPFGEDFEEQKVIITNWAQRVKELSE